MSLGTSRGLSPNPWAPVAEKQSRYTFIPSQPGVQSGPNRTTHPLRCRVSLGGSPRCKPQEGIGTGNWGWGGTMVAGQPASEHHERQASGR